MELKSWILGLNIWKLRVNCHWVLTTSCTSI